MIPCPVETSNVILRPHFIRRLMHEQTIVEQVLNLTFKDEPDSANAWIQDVRN